MRPWWRRPIRGWGVVLYGVIVATMSAGFALVDGGSVVAAVVASTAGILIAAVISGAATNRPTALRMRITLLVGTVGVIAGVWWLLH